MSAATTSAIPADVPVEDAEMWCDRTEQAWWQDWIEPFRKRGLIETRFLRGRLRFDTPDHDYTKQPKGNRPPFGVCLVIWRRIVD